MQQVEEVVLVAAAALLAAAVVALAPMVREVALLVAAVAVMAVALAVGGLMAVLLVVPPDLQERAARMALMAALPMGAIAVLATARFESTRARTGRGQS